MSAILGLDGNITADQLNASFNNKTLRPFHAALAKRNTQKVNIGVLGDSGVESHPVTSWNQRYPDLIGQGLRAKHPTNGLSSYGMGYVGIPQGLVAANWPLVTSGGTYNQTAGYGAKHIVQLLAAGNTVTLTLPTAFANATSFEIHFVKGSTGAVGGGFYKIDGGTAVNFDTNNASAASAILTVNSPVTSTIQVGMNSGQTYVAGIRVYKGDESKGIHIHNLGYSGSKCSDWLLAPANPATWGSAIALLNLDLLIITLGGNEYINGVPVNVYQANLKALIAQLRAAGVTCPIVLSMLYDVAPAAPVDTWANYVTAAQQLTASDSTLMVVDNSLRMPKTNAASTYGLYYTDFTHSAVDGSAYSYMADTVVNAIAPR